LTPLVDTHEAVEMKQHKDVVLFGYGRVSTADQHTSNQRKELEDAGWPIATWFEDTGVSGASTAAQRPAFRKLLEAVEVILGAGQKAALVVSKLDRLGRDTIDVLQTIKALGGKKVRVYVHQLGDFDLTSTAGKMTLSVLAAVAEMERDLIRERTVAGQARAKAEGKHIGRPASTTHKDRREILRLLAAGTSVSEVARQFNVSRGTVINVRDAAA
jgi:putative DNA-invertase from lambdoid prophage Rac